MDFLNALFTAALDSNLVFGQLVAMVTVFLVAYRPQDACRFGAQLGGAVAVAGVIGWLAYDGFLVPWGVAYLAPLAYVLAGTAAILVIGTIRGAGKPSQDRTRILRSCVLIALNAAVLAAPLANHVNVGTWGFDSALGASLGCGLGTALAVVVFATIRNRVDDRLVPHVMRGLPISLVTASLISLAFTGVAGIAAGLFV